METLVMEPYKRKEQPKFLLLIDSRMLTLMEYIVNNPQIFKIRSENIFAKTIGITHATNLYSMKAGVTSFTRKSISLMISVYNVDANYLFVEDYTKMFRDTPTGAYEELMEAVLRIGVELGKKGKIIDNK